MDKSGKDEFKKMKIKSNIKKHVTPHEKPTKTNLRVSQLDWKTSVYSQAQNFTDNAISVQGDESTIPHLSQHIAQTNFSNSYKTQTSKKHHPSPIAQILAKEIEGYSLKEIDSEVNALLQGKYTDSLTIPEFKERIMQNLKLNNNDSIYYSDSDSDC